MTHKQTPLSPYEEIGRLKDPLTMFDLCIAGSFMAGQLGGKIPVDETRKVFEKIKKILEKKL